MYQLIRTALALELHREFDRLFNDFLPSLSGDAAPGWALDVAETDGADLARIDLPGRVPAGAADVRAASA